MRRNPEHGAARSAAHPRREAVPPDASGLAGRQWPAAWGRQPGGTSAGPPGPRGLRLGGTSVARRPSAAPRGCHGGAGMGEDPSRRGRRSGRDGEQRVPVVRRRGPATAALAAPLTGMGENGLARAELDAHRAHHPAAARPAVAWVHVDVARAQTAGTVVGVAVTAHGRPADEAVEVLGDTGEAPAHPASLLTAPASPSPRTVSRSHLETRPGTESTTDARARRPDPDAPAHRVRRRRACRALSPAAWSRRSGTCADGDDRGCRTHRMK